MCLTFDLCNDGSLCTAVTRLIITVILALAFGNLFLQLDTSDSAGVNSLNSFIFVTNLFIGVIYST